MAAACGGEVEDLITCPICLCEYDEEIENRKPKFLSCSHTVCLQCLKGLQNSFLVSCPLCRKILCPTGTLDIASVPTNSYALCILKLTKAQRKPAEPVKNVSQPNWCFTCGSIGRVDCPTLHSTLDMTAHTMSNFEALLAVKEHYAKVKEPLRSKLESAVEKEKELQNYHDKILKALKSLETDILKLDAHSQSRLGGMIFLMESRFIATRSKEEENEAFLSELFSMGDSSQTLETLKKKMEASFQEIKTKLNSTESDSELPDLVNSTRISVKLFPENSSTPLPCPTLLENGFTSKWRDDSSTSNLSPTLRDQLLLSHLLFSIRNRHGMKAPVTDHIPLLMPFASIAPPSATSAASPIPPALSIPRPVPQVSRFVPDESFFVLTVMKSQNIVGQVHFQTIPNIYSNFFKNLGDFCFENARPMTLPMEKAVAEVYVNIPLSVIDGFILPDISQPAVCGYLITESCDVGLMMSTNDDVGATSTPPKWGLIFMLDKCLQPNFAKPLNHLKSVPLCGRMITGLRALNLLSGESKAERSNYTFTLESREDLDF